MSVFSLAPERGSGEAKAGNSGCGRDEEEGWVKELKEWLGCSQPGLARLNAVFSSILRHLNASIDADCLEWLNKSSHCSFSPSTMHVSSWKSHCVHLWDGNSKSTVAGEAECSGIWICDMPVDRQIPVQYGRRVYTKAGSTPPAQIQTAFFWRGRVERWEMETGNRLFGLGKSFPDKHKSRWLWLNAIDCSAESCALAGPLFLCMDTQHLVGLCPGVFA